MAKDISQLQLLMEYFKNNPNREIEHPEIVDWATKEFLKRTGKVFRDPDRGIRKLHQNGLLIKVRKGAYKYDPDAIGKPKGEDFTATQKEKILKRDGYKCVVCSKGREEGMELHVDHIIPKDKGGKAEIDNGQTLCSEHNIFKKKYNQTEFTKRLFIKMYQKAKSADDQLMMQFYNDVLELYEKYGIDQHIKFKK